jgi:hypothetical protein
LRQKTQAENQKQKIFDQLKISRQTLLFLQFSLFVGAAVYSAPQEWQRNKLLFANALLFFACYDVAHVFFSTCTAWSYVENSGVDVAAGTDCVFLHKKL